MELTCSRCHQTVQPADCYCPFCGLPQLVYTADAAAAAGQPERWNEAVRDAGAIDWKPAMRSALALAVPAGILCAGLTRVGPIGALLMPLAAAWVVALYMRGQRPAWITTGAGARIGLMTGILGGWVLMLSPEGRAGSMLFNTSLLAMIILAFAIGGGALSARLLGRPRRPES
jgi:hypothetical protein